MLDNDQGVAQIPQVLQRPQQLIVVPLVQTDGRLVQNIQHAHQGRTDLGSQPDHWLSPPERVPAERESVR